MATWVAEALAEHGLTRPLDVQALAHQRARTLARKGKQLLQDDAPGPVSQQSRDTAAAAAGSTPSPWGEEAVLALCGLAAAEARSIAAR